MTRQRSLITAFLVSVLILGITGGALLLVNLTRMQPQHEDIIYTSGLQNTVEIVRDDFGVPHIYASNVDDLFFAQGYVHAQDRWWQMETARHTGHGQKITLTGLNAESLRSDLKVHVWSGPLPDESTSTANSPVLTAYTAGVNAVIAGRPGGELALEYTLLELAGRSIHVEPWQPDDSLVELQMVSDQINGNALHEVERAQLYEALGTELADAYFPPYPYNRLPTILTADDLGLPLTAEEEITQPVPPDYEGVSFATTTLLPAQQNIQGNSWVLNSANTATEAPLLAADRNANIQLPAGSYQMGLHCRPITDDCPYDVVGFSTPGIPAITSGHNGSIAWNISNAHADTQDLYILRINPENRYQYEYEGEWHDMSTYPVVIPLTGTLTAADNPDTPACEGISGLPFTDDGDLVFQIRATSFGTIVTDNIITPDCRFVAIPDNVTSLALRQTNVEPAANLQALIGMNQAKTGADFQTASATWTGPAINIIYAEQSGDIGYQLAGSIPIRAAEHSGVFPVPGWTNAYEWRGLLTYNNLSSLLQVTNPEQGWIVAADQPITPPAYSAYMIEQLADEFGSDINPAINQHWPDGYRASRIIQQINATAAHTIGRQFNGTDGTLAALQADSHNILAEELLPYLVRVDFEETPLPETVQWLIDWNLQNTPNSPQAALFETFWVVLIDNLYNDQLPTPSDGPVWATIRLLEQPNHAWWDDSTTPDITETRDDILRQSFAEAINIMQRQWGIRPENWHWGDLHTATFINTPPAYSDSTIINTIFNRENIPTSGGTTTVNHTAYPITAPYNVHTLPEQRAIYDLQNPDNSLAIQTTGQSGHPLSPNYDDMLEYWRTFSYRPLLLTDEAIINTARQTLELRPAPATNHQQ